MNLNKALTASAELNADLGAHCSSKINVIISNGGVGKLETRTSDTTYVLTLNNWACEGQKEDCWRAEVFDQLRTHGATILNLPIESHRDYVKKSIVQYIDPCEGIKLTPQFSDNYTYICILSKVRGALFMRLSGYCH